MVLPTDNKQLQKFAKIKVGSFIKLDKYYGTVLRYQPVEEHENNIGRVAKLKMLITSGIIWDFTLFAEDHLEVLQ